MNLNRRQLLEHEEYEPESYYSSFTAEMELSASNMWLLWHTLRQMVQEAPSSSVSSSVASSVTPSGPALPPISSITSLGAGSRCSRGDLLVRLHGRLLSALSLRFRAWLQQLLTASSANAALDIARVSQPLLDVRAVLYNVCTLCEPFIFYCASPRDSLLNTTFLWRQLLLFYEFSRTRNVLILTCTSRTVVYEFSCCKTCTHEYI